MKVGDRIINLQNGFRGTVTLMYNAGGRPRYVQFLEKAAGGEILRYLPVSEVEKDPEAEIH